MFPQINPTETAAWKTLIVHQIEMNSLSPLKGEIFL